MPPPHMNNGPALYHLSSLANSTDAAELALGSEVRGDAPAALHGARGFDAHGRALQSGMDSRAHGADRTYATGRSNRGDRCLLCVTERVQLGHGVHTADAVRPDDRLCLTCAQAVRCIRACHA